MYSLENTLPYNCCAKSKFHEKMEKERIRTLPNYSRLYFLFLAAVLMYCGVLALKTRRPGSCPHEPKSRDIDISFNSNR